jgi:hypothetical protein
VSEEVDLPRELGGESDGEYRKPEVEPHNESHGETDGHRWRWRCCSLQSRQVYLAP